MSKPQKTGLAASFATGGGVILYLFGYPIADGLDIDALASINMGEEKPRRRKRLLKRKRFDISGSYSSTMLVL